MHVLFLDESYAHQKNYVGYGGYCVDSAALDGLTRALSAIKETNKVAEDVEVKWSTGRRRFPDGWNQERHIGLCAEMLQALADHGATVICAVAALDHCYGPRDHGWTKQKTDSWAKQQLLRLVAERFENPYLESVSSTGLIVCDQFGDKPERALIDQFAHDLRFGTTRQSFKRIVSVPLMTSSKHSSHLQFADVVVGIVVQTLAGAKNGTRLFDRVGQLMLRHPDAANWTVSFAVIDYGLKPFPREFVVSSAFASLNASHKASASGLVPMPVD